MYSTKYKIIGRMKILNTVPCRQKIDTFELRGAIRSYVKSDIRSKTSFQWHFYFLTPFLGFY